VTTRFLARLFTCLLFVSTAHAAEGKDKPKPSEWPAVGNPIVREITDYAEFAGRTDAAQTVDIRPRVTGPILKVDFKEGSTVKKGDVLFEIESRQYELELERAAATLKEHEAGVNLANTQLERQKALRQKSVDAEPELKKAETVLEQAKAKVLAAKAVLQIAELNLSWTKIKSPIDGRIGRSLLDAGNLVQANKTLLATVCSTNPMYAYFDVDERTFLRIVRPLEKKRKSDPDSSLNAMVGLADDDGYPITAKMDFTGSQIDPKTATLRVRAVLLNLPHLVLPGMFVRVRIATSQPHKALLIPKQCVGLTAQSDEKWVLVAHETNKLERRVVKLGAQYGELVEVLDGLKADDRVVFDHDAFNQLQREKSELQGKKSGAPKDKQPK